MTWPRVMRAKTAASYVDESPRSFRARVGKVWPRPKRIPGKGEFWLKDDLDRAIDRLVGESTDHAEII